MRLFPNDRPPIDWSFRERAKGFGILSFLLSLGLCGFTLLIADIPAAVVPTRYAPTGVPLWPVVRFVVVMPVAGAWTFAVFMPLYRYRLGGYVVGSLVVVAVLATKVLTGGDVPRTSLSADMWQLAVVAIIMLWMGAYSGAQASDHVLHGREGTPPRPVQ